MKYEWGKVCYFKFISVYNMFSFFVFSLLALDFLLAPWSLLFFQNLGYMPLNKDELIPKAASASERGLLFRSTNMHHVHKGTWICI